LYCILYSRSKNYIVGIYCFTKGIGAVARANSEEKTNEIKQRGERKTW